MLSCKVNDVSISEVMKRIVMMGEDGELRTHGSILGPEADVLRLFVVFLSPSRQILRSYIKVLLFTAIVFNAA
jgi:hypothetical protein